MSWSQRPFTAAGNLVTDVVVNTAAAVENTVAAVPEAASLAGTSIRASIPGLPAGGSLNPLENLPTLPNISLPDIGLPGIEMPDIQLPSLPQLPEVQMPELIQFITLPSMSMPKIDMSVRDMGLPYGELIGLPEGKSLLPSMRMSWRSGMNNDMMVIGSGDFYDPDVEMRDLSAALDLDKLRSAFVKYAGHNEEMDQEEFKIFARKLQMSDELAASLWRNFDADGSGFIDATEFKEGLELLTSARVWLRFCPTCDFANSCAYCEQVQECAECTRERFCIAHWRNHPDRGKYVADNE